MEIDKAVKECDDRRLKTKYANAIYVIQRALALYSYVLSFLPSAVFNSFTYANPHLEHWSWFLLFIG